MSAPNLPDESSAPPPVGAEGPASDEPPIHPRSDLFDGFGWIALGLAILIASIRMDRLEQQHINPYTVPGLLPGLLGILMMLLGGVLAFRSWRRGALRLPKPAPTADSREQWMRIWVVIALCAAYAIGLVGHGIPFWLASAIYVTGSILILQRMSRDASERPLVVRTCVKAIVIGLAAGIVTQVVFQELFLVRMP